MQIRKQKAQPLGRLHYGIACLIFLTVLSALGGAGFGSSAAAAAACDRFASPAGSDAATGTSVAPYRSAGKLVSSLTAGQTGCLLGGTYAGNLTIAAGGSSDTNRITLTTAPGYEQATLSAGYVYVRPEAKYVTLENIRIDGTSPVVTVQLFGDGAVLRGSEITNQHRGESCITVGEYEGSYARVVNDVVIDGNRIHGCGMAANGNHDHGIYLASTRYAKVINNTIFDNVGGWGIQLWADAHFSQISHNVLDGNYGGNIIVAGGNYTSAGPSSNNTFSDNIITWPTSRYNAESWWEGSAGTNNVFTSNCVYGGVTGNWGSLGDGFTALLTTVANPLYVDRAANDFRLRAESPCAGKGPVAPAPAPEPPPPPPPEPTTPADFSISTAATSLNLSSWSGVSTALTLTPTGGFIEPVTISVSGLPSDVIASLSRNPVSLSSTPNSTDLTLIAVPTAIRVRGRDYTVTVTATSASKTHSLQFQLRVMRNRF